MRRSLRYQSPEKYATARFMFLPKTIDSRQTSFPISCDGDISSQLHGSAISVPLNYGTVTHTQC